MHGPARLRGIQGLRAIAAMAVVTYHATDMGNTRHGLRGAVSWPNGAAGVDIFFVVSGFVMVVVSQGSASWRAFLKARLVRIVPLYWLCSAVKIAAVTGASAAGLTARLGWRYCAASLLFLPVHDLAGRFQPVLPVGWTLSFEMMFYGLFAAALAARLRPVVWLPPVLMALTLLPHAHGSVIGELANPIVLEFGFGTTLATAWLAGWRLPGWLDGLVLAGSVWLLFVAPPHFLGGRVASWGVPAAALVAATVGLECRLGTRIPKLILALGHSSYAIYLTHGFVLAGLAFARRHFGPDFQWALPNLACSLAACASCGWIVHVTIEKPLRRVWVSRSRKVTAEVIVLAGGGLAPASGGVGVLMGYLLEAWAASPHPPRVRVIDTRGQGGRLSAIPRFAGASLMFTWLGLTGRMQLVHAHMTTRGSAARKTLLCSVAMLFAVPVIVHMHGADFIPFYRRLSAAPKAVVKAVLRRVQHVIVLGDAWRDFLIEEVGVAPSRISVVLNGVKRPAVARPARATGPARILFLGRLCARKGLPELIAALASPAVKGLDWRAVVAGDGEVAAFQALLRLHGLEARVTMPGWVTREQAASLLAEADMLVLPSHHEAMPMAVVEALAAEVAVIATPVGAIPEFLQNGVNALLVPPGETGCLAEAIGVLLTQPTLRNRLAEAGHVLFCDRLEIGPAADQIARLYQDVVAGHTALGGAVG